MKAWMLILVAISASYSSVLYRLKSGDMQVSANGAPYTFEVRRYLVVNDDSTYQTAGFPVNAFGMMVSAIVADSGNWKVQGDSIQLQSKKCETSRGTCGTDSVRPKFPFRNGVISDSGFQVSKEPSDTTVVRRLHQGFQEVDSQKTQGTFFTIIGVGMLLILGIIVLSH